MSQYKVAILGITGSIGSQTVEVVRHLGWGIKAASARKNINKLLDLQNSLNIEAVYSPNGNFDRRLFEESVFDADILVVAISDVSELPLVHRFLQSGKRVAIATKEMIILGYDLFDKYRWKNLYPIDSEHATVYMLMKPYRELVEKVILTASGGAFRDLTISEIDNVDPQQALKHPVWNMGMKITVDSASLANKGIELLEARVLFDIPPHDLSAVIHREVLVHAMITLTDGFTLMGAYRPSMLLPIQFALLYPHLTPSLVETIDWKNGTLSFEDIPLSKYGMYALALDVLRSDDKALYMLYLIADEIVVEKYIGREIVFSQMPLLAEKIISALSGSGGIPQSAEERVNWYIEMKKRAKEVVI